MCEMPLSKIFVADLCMHNGLIKIEGCVHATFYEKRPAKNCSGSRTIRMKCGAFQDECSLRWLVPLLFVLADHNKDLNRNRSTSILNKRNFSAFLREKWTYQRMLLKKAYIAPGGCFVDNSVFFEL